MANRPRLLTLIVAAGLACGAPTPRQLQYGAERCSHCHMTLADPRFAGQIVTVTGKVLPFDDVGCLAMYVVTGGIPGNEIHAIWVNDFGAPDALVRATEAVFLASNSLHTPMDYGLAASAPGSKADSLSAALSAKRLTWSEVLDRVRSRGP